MPKKPKFVLDPRDYRRTTPRDIGSGIASTYDRKEASPHVSRTAYNDARAIVDKYIVRYPDTLNEQRWFLVSLIERGLLAFAGYPAPP